MKFAQDIVLAPVITENSMAGIADKKYTFKVEMCIRDRWMCGSMAAIRAATCCAKKCRWAPTAWNWSRRMASWLKRTTFIICLLYTSRCV